MDFEPEDEVLRAVLQESLRTAAEEQQRHAEGSTRADEPTNRLNRPTPSAPVLQLTEQQAIDVAMDSSNMSWEQQRLEALRHQRERWEQLHSQPAQHQELQDPGRGQAAGYPAASALPSDVPAAGMSQHLSSSSGVYPPIPGLVISEAAAAGAADISAEQRRLRQEEEDHKLALQLAAAFEEEDREGGGTPGLELDGDDHHDSRSGSTGDEWEEVVRTASMQQQQQPEATAGNGSYNRPSSQAAATAGSGIGGVVGAGLSALLAMAAHAAESSQSDVHAAPGGATAATSGTAVEGAGGSSSASASTNPGSTNTQQSSSSSSGGDQPSGFLNAAASVLRNFLAGRNQATSSSSATASTSSHGAAAAGSSSDAGRWGLRDRAQPEPGDMLVLQQLMQAMMGGPAAAAAGGTDRDYSTDAQQARGSGFRVVRLPGGGFAASYSSGTQQQQQNLEHAGPGFPMFADDNGPFGFMGGEAGMDPLSQLLLAGARSAHGNHRWQQQQEGLGFTHFDPSAGPHGRFEPMDREGFDPTHGLEALIGALMGQGMFDADGRGLGGFRYEDLVGLDPVNVSTPEEVLSSLPKSTFVEGRKPGDSDTCVICQTAYAAGDELMHLPCLHAFHADCIMPWLQGHSKKCPVCKTDVC